MAFNNFCSSDVLRFSNESALYTSLPKKVKLNPPKASYKITTKLKKFGSCYNKVEYTLENSSFLSFINFPQWLDISLYAIKSSVDKHIFSLYIQNYSIKTKIKKNIIFSNNKSKQKDSSTAILYFHENETDLFRILPFLIDLSVQMKCDVISFDYSGFGCSSGKAGTSEKNNLIQDSEKVTEFIFSFLNYKIENVVLFARDIGCTPAVYLASKTESNNYKGLILLEPIINEKFLQRNEMRKIICPTLVIKEVEEKNDSFLNEIIIVCRDISNEKEWFPKKKINKENDENDCCNSNKITCDDVLVRHRCKFLMKLKELIYPEKINFDKDFEIKKKNKGSFCGSSTSPESSSNNSLLTINNNYLINYVNENNIINNLLNENNDTKNNIIDNSIENNNEKRTSQFFEEYEEDYEESNKDEDY